MTPPFNSRTSIQAAWCSQASAYAYKVDTHATKDPNLGIRIDVILVNGVGQIRGYIGSSEKIIVVAISGTESVNDALVDARFIQTLSKVDRKTVGIHAGFHSEYHSIKRQIDSWFCNNAPHSREVFVTGHSMGGAVAKLVALHLAVHYKIDPLTYTFGSPRVGDWRFRKQYNKHVKYNVRVVHDYDIVPRIPKIGYWHVNHLLHLRLNGTVISPSRRFMDYIKRLLHVIGNDFEGDSVKAHFMENYIEATLNYHNQL